MVKISFFTSLVVSLYVSIASSASTSQNVCVYFDKVDTDPNYQLGKVYALMTENLLGHFQEARAVVAPLNSYKKGDLLNCDKLIYLGTYYNAKIPSSFVKDLESYQDNVLWVNYNIWQLDRKLVKKLWGIEFLKLEQYSDMPSEQNKDPGFFRYFWYKGERFHKLSLYSKEQRKTIATPEIALVRKQTAEVLSYSEHNKDQRKTPYITRNENHFYVADTPFAYIHESDRYLIFADILFDFLELKPRESKKRALVRIEDVHPNYDLNLLRRTFALLRKHEIPFTISVIPKYVDAFGFYNGRPIVRSIEDNPEFLKILKYAESIGGRVIYHGYTHQVDNMLNCSGESGSDYEFWDGCERIPIPFADKKWVLNRLEKGRDLFQNVGIDYVAWVPPHYEASQIAYKTFGEFFSRTVQRVRYIPYDTDPNIDKRTWAGQFFPYTIYKDYYGQYIYPENLGNIRVPRDSLTKEEIDKHMKNLRSPEQMIESLKLNRVIRDSWASFFWHPQLIRTKAGIRSLEKVITAVKEEGYEFTNLSELE